MVYHLYESSIYPVDTDNAQNLLITHLKENEIRLDSKHGELFFAVTSADRYGNESAPLALNKASEIDIPILNQGDKMMLPELANIQNILICNHLGETISKVMYHREISLELLPEGFYLVYAQDKDGDKTLVGTILK